VLEGVFAVMLCEKCHKNLATTRYAEVVDGKVKELHLCADCLAKHQSESGAGFEFTKPVLAGKGPREAQSTSARPPRQRVQRQQRQVRCRYCGQTLDQVLKSGRMGCSTCYETFGEYLDTLLQDLQLGLRHRGKAPHVDDLRARMHADLQTKRALLRSALRTENYEEAACLRDEIRVLEQELVAPGKDA